MHEDEIKKLEEDLNQASEDLQRIGIDDNIDFEVLRERLEKKKEAIFMQAEKNDCNQSFINGQLSMIDFVERIPNRTRSESIRNIDRITEEIERLKEDQKKYEEP